ncbi:MAG: exopolyphosphatase [Planctomycetes bacterium RBG_16_64_10]|nr:MAG: exopolyphosphatase [Planctomycetes bacterium RBG_16_64_10]
MSSDRTRGQPCGTATATDLAKPVAVIDIGTSAIRMAIAEIGPEGQIHKLETLTQDVQLGRDAFTRGAIGRATIEDCVRVLKSYRQMLDEYQITRSDRIRVVATNAVREAENQLAFLDRIYIATGFQVEPTDEAEVSRITYLGIQPYLRREPALANATALVLDVGGGSTEVLVVRGSDVLFSHSYKLGSLRLREMLEAYRAPTGQLRNIMESQIRRTVEQIVQQVASHPHLEMIALGEEIRFAASQVQPEVGGDGLARIPIRSLQPFVDMVLDTSVDELVQSLHLTFANAETLGPTLLSNVSVARALKLKDVYVGNVDLRDGLLREMAVASRWTEESFKPVIQSVLDLGRKYQFDERHARHVAELAKMLFHELRSEHRMDARYELILCVAALLHEIGTFVGTRNHHKHTFYLITNSELFGLRTEDLDLIGLVSRYHRGDSPKPNHEKYIMLDREQRIAVAKLAALLRVADALDRSRSQRVQQLHCQRDNGRLVISIPNVDDLSLEELALKEKGPLFEEIFGLQVLLRKVGS